MKRYLVLFLAVLALANVASAQKHKKEKVVVEQTVHVGASAHSSTLTWTPPTTCVDGSACTPSGYNVYRATVACPASGLPTGATKIASNISAANYTDTTITAPGTYCYYVTALNSAGESAASNTAGGSLAQPALSAPTNFSVTVQ